MLEGRADRIPGPPVRRRPGQGRGVRDGAGAGSAAGGDGGRGSPLDAAADPVAAEPAAGLRGRRGDRGRPTARARTPGSGPGRPEHRPAPGARARARLRPGCRATGSGCAVRGLGRLRAARSPACPGSAPASTAAAGAGTSRRTGLGAAARQPPGRPSARAPPGQAGSGARGRGGHVRTRGRRTTTRRRAGAGSSTGRPSTRRPTPPAAACARGPARAAARSRRPPARAGRRAGPAPCAAGAGRPPSAPRTTSQVPGAPPPAGQECSSARAVRTISACCAPISSRSGGPGGRVRRGGGPGVEHHAAVDVDQGCGDDSHVTQQWSEHGGDAVGPDVHHVAVASHEAPRSPLPQPAVDQRWPALDGKNAWLSPRPLGPAVGLRHVELLLDDPQVAPRHRQVGLRPVEHQVQEQLLVVAPWIGRMRWYWLSRVIRMSSIVSFAGPASA